MKVILSALFIIALSTNANAQEAEEHKGLSVGAGIAHIMPEIDFAQDDVRLNWSDSSQSLYINLAYTYILNEKHSFQAGLNYNIQDADAGSDTYSRDGLQTVNLTIDNMLSVYFQPSMKVTENTSVFASIIYSKMDVSGEGVNAPNWINDYFSTSGIGFGVGVSTKPYDNLIIKAELSTTSYESKTITVWWGTGTYEQDVDQVSLSVQYLF